MTHRLPFRAAMCSLLCCAVLFAGRAGAEPEPGSAPLAAVTNDSVVPAPRAPLPATSLLGAPGHASPGSAFAIGLLATVGPYVVTRAAIRDRSVDGGAIWGAQFAAVSVGAIAGPAIGLAVGGRDDRALSGLLLRSGAYILMAGATYAAVNTAWNGSGDSAWGLAGVAVGSGIVVLGSGVYDLLSTPAAVEAGKPRVALGLRPDGRAAVSVRF